MEEKAKPEKKNDNENIDLFKGREFNSFEDLQRLLALRCEAYGDRWRIDSALSWTIARYNKDIDNKERHFPDHLRYKRLKMRCIHEGTHKPRREGAVKRQKT